MIQYTLSSKAPNTHIFNVSVQFQASSGKHRVCLPNWCPGSYKIRDFSKHILEISATQGEPDNKQSLVVTQIDSSTFEVTLTSEGRVCFEYAVYAWDLSVRGAHLDSTHGFVNGSAMFLCVEGQALKPCTLTVVCPTGTTSWALASSICAQDGILNGFGSYEVKNYYDLIDHPLEMGCFDTRTFKVGEVVHHLVVTGQHQGDLERLVSDLKQICQYQAQVFGGALPFEGYVFLLTVVGEGYGGLEHANSCALISPRTHLPVAGMKEITSGYQSLLGLFSHEYFHAWNVKRIKPKVYHRPNLQEKVFTTQLWAF